MRALTHPAPALGARLQNGGTPLRRAVEKGHAAIVALLRALCGLEKAQDRVQRYCDSTLSVNRWL